MRKLGGIDADLLYAETPTTHMHVGALVLVDPRRVPGGFGAAEVRRLLAARVATTPVLRERVVEVPMRLDAPSWVEDPRFDLDDHLHRCALPAPGGPRELGAVVGDLMGRKLEGARPLWEVWCIERLASGELALFAKVHHAVADGVGGALLLGGLFGTEPVDLPADLPRPPEPAGPLPRGAELLVRSLPAIATRPLRYARAAVRTGRSVAGLTRHPPEAASSAARPFAGPRTSFNHELTADRSFAFASLPLDDVKHVRRAFDATVNDVVLAVCAGALRSYLRERDELPAVPLVAAVPVSVRGEEEALALGNLVSGWFADLATDEADPLARLSRIREAALGAKAVHASGIEDVVMEWAAIPAPAVWTLGLRLVTAAHLAERMPPMFNLLLSNVPGSPVTLYAGPAPVTATFPYGPLLDGVGLNITVMSYRGSVDVGIATCPALVSDPWAIARHLEPALAELTAAAGA